MAGSVITEYLAGQDYEAFHYAVRQFAHDSVNRISRITTQAGIIQRMLEKVPHHEIFITPEAIERAGDLAADAGAVIDTLNQINVFFWPEGPGTEGTEAINRQRWQPYDAQAWDIYLEEFGHYLREQMEVCIPMVSQLVWLEYTSGVNPDGRGMALLAARDTLFLGFLEVFALLKPQVVDALLPEWLDRKRRREQHSAPR